MKPNFHRSLAASIVATSGFFCVTETSAQSHPPYQTPSEDYLALERAQNEANSKPGPRFVPARTLPVPSTVSARLQEIIAAPYAFPRWTANHPASAADWKTIVQEQAARTSASLPAIREQLSVAI